MTGETGSAADVAALKLIKELRNQLADREATIKELTDLLEIEEAERSGPYRND